MSDATDQLSAIKDIKRMMERSSRFISLSGWSGISAGICALVGAWVAHSRIDRFLHPVSGRNYYHSDSGLVLMYDLIQISAVTFIAAFVSAFIFTWSRSRRNGTPLWDPTVQRLAWNTILPMVVGGIVILR